MENNYRKAIKIAYLYTYGFLMLYKPAILPISSNYLMSIWAVVGMLLLTKGKLRFYENSSRGLKPIKIMATVIITLGVYLFFTISYTSGEYSHIWFYMIFIAFLIQALYFIFYAEYMGCSQQGIMKILVRIGIAQSCITIMMLISPQLKNIIVNYLGVNSGQTDFLTRAMSVRVFGIAGEYFYTIGLIHGFLSVYMFNSAISNKKYKSIFISIFLLIPALLNARIGVICAVSAMTVILIFNILKNDYRSRLRTVFILMISVGLVIIGFQVIRITSESTYTWIFEGFNAVNDLVSGEENRYYGKLVDDFLVWPRGYYFIIGYGEVPGGKTYYLNNGYVSDIGYVIDIHVGGIVLAIIYYFGLLKCLIHRWEWMKNDQKIYRLALALFIGIANYKGRVAGASDFLILLLIALYAEYSFNSRNALYIGDVNNGYRRAT